MTVSRCGAHCFRLPVAVAKYLACDLVERRGGDFDQLRGRRGQVVGTRQEVAEDGLQVAV